MQEERKKNAGRNIFFGVLLKMYQILVPFLMRTAIIYCLGIQYLGLNSLFTSILQVLNLAELGVGGAMVYSMYKPVAESDGKSICALMRLYKIYYRIIGLVIAILGMCLLPFIPKLIKSDVPADVNIYILYLLNLSVTVLSYWLFAYKNCLLEAHQRADVASKVTLVTNTIQYILQFLVLFYLKNYYLFIIVSLITQAMTNVVTAVVAGKMYPQYHPHGKLEKNKITEINHRIRDLFTSKVGTVILGSVDTLVISAFLGLKVLAIYQNYYYIMNSIYCLVGVILTSVMAGIGNSLIVESPEKNYQDFRKFSFLISWIINICCCCFVALYQPFMELWVGKKLMLPFSYVILFCIYYYVCELSMVWATYKDAAGLWHADRFRPLIGATVNLILNIILVQFIGLYGILLSTILSYVFVSMPWLVHNLFQLLFKKSFKPYLCETIKYMLASVVSIFSTYWICKRIYIGGIGQLIVCAIVAVIVPILYQYILFHKSECFRLSVELVKKMIGRK